MAECAWRTYFGKRDTTLAYNQIYQTAEQEHFWFKSLKSSQFFPSYVNFRHVYFHYEKWLNSGNINRLYFSHFCGLFLILWQNVVIKIKIIFFSREKLSFCVTSFSPQKKSSHPIDHFLTGHRSWLNDKSIILKIHAPLLL